jgi:hypothetical protein
MRENAPWYLRPIAYLEEQRIKRYEGQLPSQITWLLKRRLSSSQVIMKKIRIRLRSSRSLLIPRSCNQFRANLTRRISSL